jgi:hypothetical protein
MICELLRGIEKVMEDLDANETGKKRIKMWRAMFHVLLIIGEPN